MLRTYLFVCFFLSLWVAQKVARTSLPAINEPIPLDISFRPSHTSVNKPRPKQLSRQTMQITEVGVQVGML